MNDALREKLRQVLATHGRQLLDDRARCEALMWLAAGEDSQGMFALVGALERKVPHAVLTAPPDRRGEELFAKLTRRLVEDLDMDEATARWAVESWARAVADAPAQPRPAAEPSPARPAPPPAPGRKPAAPPPAVPLEFADLPSLTIDDAPPPIPDKPDPKHALINLDRFFAGQETEGSFLHGSTEGVTCVAYAPDGFTLATGHADHTVKLWDATTGRLLGTLTRHAGPVRAIAFAPDGGELASAGGDGVVVVWDAVSRRPRTVLTGHQGAVTSLGYGLNGSTLASGGADGTARLWDAGGGSLRATLEGHNAEVTGVAFSPDGGTLATASLDRTVKLWDVGFGSYWATLAGHADGVTALAYSVNGELLVTGGRDRTVRIWNAVTARAVATLEGLLEGHTQPVLAVAFAPGGWTVASAGADEAVRIWDVADRKELQCFTGHTGAVRALAWAPDGRWLVSAGADQAVRRWRPPRVDRPPVSRTPVTRPASRAGSVGKAGAWVGGAVFVLWLLLRLVNSVSRSPGHPQQAWDGVPPRVEPQPFADFNDLNGRVLTGHRDGVTAVAVAADGGRALSGGFDGTLRLWDLDNAVELRRFEGHTAAVLGVALSPDGARALSASLDRTVRLWDVETGKELRRYEGFASGVTGVAFAPDGKRFAAACGYEHVTHTIKNDNAQGPLEHLEWRRPQPQDGTVHVRDVESGQEVYTFRHGDEATAVAFTPDGKHLVSASFDRTLSLWDVRTGEEVRRFRGHKGEVFGVAVSPDGKRLLSCGGTLGPVADGKGPKDEKPAAPAKEQDSTVRLWDLATGREIRKFTGHANAVLGVAFSPDGTRAVSAGFDATVRVWDVETGVQLRVFHGHGAAVHAAVFTPDGQRVLSAGWDKNLRLWPVR